MGVDKLKLEVVLNAVDKLTRPMGAMKSQSRELATQIKATQAQIKALTETNTMLARRMAAGEVPTQAMMRAQSMADAEAARLNETLRAQQDRLDAVNARMQRHAAINASQANIARRRDSLARNGAGLTAAGGVTLASVGSTVNAYAEAEDAAIGLKVAVMDARGQVSASYAEIEALATRLGDRLPGTTADYQNMMQMLVRQGLSAQSILGGTGEATAYLAVQLKKPTDQAAEFAAKMQDATRTVEGDMMSLMDVIQRTYYLGVDENNMLNAFAKLSPALDIIKQKGLAGAQAMAPLVVMADQAGMAGEAAGNAYRKVFQFAMNAGKVTKAGGKAGLDLDFTNGKGEFGGLPQLFAQLDKLKVLNTQQRLAAIKGIFGDDAETLQVVSLMIDKGLAGYNEVQAKMANQAGLQQRVNEQLGTLKNLWGAASGTFTNVLATFGAAIAPDLKALVQWSGNVAGGIRQWAAEHPTLATWLMRTVAIVGVLLVGVGGLALGAAALLAPFAMMGGAVAGVGTALGLASAGFGLMGGAISAVMAFLAANPIVIALAALAGAAILIYRNWDGIKGGIAAVIDTIKGYWQSFTNWFGSINWTGIGQSVIQGLIAGIKNLIPGLEWTMNQVAKLMPDALKEKLGIHSPSRVFAQLGQHTMAGLDQGLQGGQGGPLGTITDITRRITAAGVASVGILSAAPAMSAGSPARSGGDVFQIYPAPGMDEAALARLVGQEIDKRDRTRAAQGRARLIDTH